MGRIHQALHHRMSELDEAAEGKACFVFWLLLRKWNCIFLPSTNTTPASSCSVSSESVRGVSLVSRRRRYCGLLGRVRWGDWCSVDAVTEPIQCSCQGVPPCKPQRQDCGEGVPFPLSASGHGTFQPQNKVLAGVKGK